jgi:hypothetical protein
MNELAISYCARVVRNPFSFYRLYVGVGLAHSRQLRLELKYLYQYQQRNSGWEYDDSRGWVFSCFLDGIFGNKP